MAGRPRGERVSIISSDGIELVADRYGPPDGDPVLFYHGGGQTRHSWGGTAAIMGAQGWCAYTCDHRGHGDSGWSPDGNYGFEWNGEDVRSWARSLRKPPVVIGASLGGIASMVALGHAPRVNARALVLVDIAPKIEPEGSGRILAFMKERMETGFESLEEAAEAVQNYTPERKRAVDLNSIRKNLRERDGRWFWHWDPAMFRDHSPEYAVQMEATLNEGLRRADCPVMLVRGRYSDVVSPESVARLKEIRPDAVYVDVSGAGHMVAGDRNDIFTEAVLDFLARAAPLSGVA
ncbi:MAG: alpha/beta hydrolase [Pseudomonadota bacterium]|nr:alpha/beta hydrolase [Pseudomonadota bacterium]